jgi:adenylylsulfate kinase-like enzyme
MLSRVTLVWVTGNSAAGKSTLCEFDNKEGLPELLLYIM